MFKLYARLLEQLGGPGQEQQPSASTALRTFSAQKTTQLNVNFSFISNRVDLALVPLSLRGTIEIKSPRRFHNHCPTLGTIQYLVEYRARAGNSQRQHHTQLSKYLYKYTSEVRRQVIYDCLRSNVYVRRVVAACLCLMAFILSNIVKFVYLSFYFLPKIQFFSFNLFIVPFMLRLSFTSCLFIICFSIIFRFYA